VKVKASATQSLMRFKSFTEKAGTATAPPVNLLAPTQKERDVVFKAVSVARALNDLSPANDFSVIRDPRTGVVVIAIRHRSTGQLIDLCRPEALLDILEHLPGPWKGMEE
jgi:hypothetical protein